MSGRGEVKIKYPTLFPDLNHMISKISTLFHVQCTFKQDKLRTSGRVEISGAAPSVIAKAVASLQAVTTSIVLTGSSEKQKSFYNELSRSPFLKQKVSELGLRIDWEKGPRGEIHGSRMHQGTLMTYVAECYDNFETRYVTFSLVPSVNNLFKKGNIGDAKFRELQQEWKGRCLMKYRFFSSDIVAHFPEDTTLETIQQLTAALDAIILSLGGSETKTKQTCVYCRTVSSSCSEFNICGHAYCSRCLLQTLGDGTCRVMCAECKTPVHIRDVKGLLSSDQFSDLCNKVLKSEILLNKTKYKYRPCPNISCSAILPLQNSLQVCIECNFTVCVGCEMASDSLSRHQGLTCEEYKALMDSFDNADDCIRGIVSRGEKYVRDNWPVNQPAIHSIIVNPGLGWKCPAYERFLGAVERGHNLDRGFYTWHGTSEQAIGPICDSGFDPKRRSGQVYGPGEYFGVDANVSLGYARNSNRLILAYVLESSVVKHQPGFCYVVNNPLDWSYSFCLPLLIINFGCVTNGPTFVIRPALSLKKSKPHSKDDITSDELIESFCGLALNPSEASVVSNVEYIAPYRWHWEDDRRILR